jgi:carbamoyltransferase
MEWGPRALGNRSFLADPRDPEVREKLNHQVKLREWFRPLAPSVMEEYRSEIFGCERYHDPFMITVYPVRKDVREKIPAVVHVDGTARPQMVRKQDNPRYWQLIDAFRRKTGIPCLLNTSFNIQEPIVCTPEDAVKTFLRSRLRYLVLENLLVERS